ncbi:hypothetical protein ACF068_30945 [Streptomyces sp. NPDC016309]|uniref:hypothetical protein n=1 Tax=Streptomyces sp. NPDC016309 TaxID=3364965 RepID=UPI0036F653DC
MGLTIRMRGRRKVLALEAGKLSSRSQSPEKGVSLAPHTAELAALLTGGLGTGVQLRRIPEICATAITLLGLNGEVLHNYGIMPERLDGPPWSPITVALVKDDPDQPIDIYLSPVPNTPVEYEGNLALGTADAAARLIRHYAPALACQANRT